MNSIGDLIGILRRASTAESLASALVPGTWHLAVQKACKVRIRNRVSVKIVGSGGFQEMVPKNMASKTCGERGQPINCWIEYGSGEN